MIPVERWCRFPNSFSIFLWEQAVQGVRFSPNDPSIVPHSETRFILYFPPSSQLANSHIAVLQAWVPNMNHSRTACGLTAPKQKPQLHHLLQNGL